MNNLSKYQTELQSLKNAEFPLKKVIDYIEKSEIIEKEVKCDADWYVLYCDTCKKVCHDKCKGPKEGFSSSTYGCDMIGTFSSACSDCKCSDTSHKFLQTYKVQEEKKNREEIEKWIEDPNLKESKEKNIKAIAEMEKTIEITQNQLNQLNSQIQYSLMNGINCLFQLALKDDELNDKALKKDNKYGFTTQMLNENLNKGKKKGTIYDEFISTLPKIENICKSDETKEKIRQGVLKHNEEHGYTKPTLTEEQKRNIVEKQKETWNKKLLESNWDDLVYEAKKTRVYLEQNGKCARCGFDTWMGEKLILEYEHKDGNHSNNARDNVECLCPNCHSLTSTWRGRNCKKFGKKEKRSNEEIVNAFIEEGNIYRALKKLGMVQKGANYERVKRILHSYGISFI